MSSTIGAGMVTSATLAAVTAAVSGSPCPSQTKWILDPGKQGSKLHLAGGRGGLPISVIVSAANAHDSITFEALLDDISPIRMPGGRRRRPGRVHADKAYDHHRCRAHLRRRGIGPRIARRRIDSSTRLGRHRFTIERAGAWLGGLRRLRIR